MCAVEAAGLRLAVMTTLVRLLEVKLVELEGPEGTGPLEEDVSLLEAHLSAGGKLQIRQGCPSVYCFRDFGAYQTG